MNTKKSYDPRASIEALVTQLRQGPLATQLQGISDDDLFGLVLEAYEKGSQDVIDAMNPKLVRALGAAEKLSGMVSQAKESSDARIEKLEEKFDTSRPPAND